MVLPFQYWPAVSWMQHFANANEIWLEQCGTYQKQSLMNRCKITGANGPIILSVPIVGGREQKTLLKEVKIDNSQRWAVQHLRSIKSCYGKAPFFDHYFPQVEQLLLQPHHWLIELDYQVMLLLQKWLKQTIPISLTQQYRGGHSTPEPFAEPAPKAYMQVFMHRYGFVARLSVLDVVFCLGPQAAKYFKQPTAGSVISK